MKIRNITDRPYPKFITDSCILISFSKFPYSHDLFQFETANSPITSYTTKHMIERYFIQSVHNIFKMQSINQLTPPILLAIISEKSSLTLTKEVQDMHYKEENLGT